MARKGQFQIDQSGKIEQTDKDTVLCLANEEEWDAILIKAKTKRQLQEIFRLNKQPRNYVLFVFCAGLAVLIKRNLDKDTITIDREYFGKEAVIKEILLGMIKENKRRPEILFGNIGRRVQAHLKGYKIYIRKIQAKKTISRVELLKEIKKTEVGKRLKNA
ncbi:MAG: hypothetical protein HY427_02425 [Candidatus Levybacteria bacterium]|nr:hypothetical protein [Candidatus Levybacteria bacterium]